MYVWTSSNIQEVNKAIGSVLAQWGVHGSPVIDSQKKLWRPPEGGVVLAMGTKALNCLQEAGYAPKGRVIASMRETPIEVGNATYLVTYDPIIRYRDHLMGVNMQIDAGLACRLDSTGSIHPTLGDYRYVKNFADAVNCIQGRYEETGKPVPVAVDLETLTLDPYNPETFIVSISVTIDEGRSDVIRFRGHDDQPEKGGDLWNQINFLLSDPCIKTRGANFKYDLVWISEKWGIECYNFTMDTTIIGSLLDENRSNSLETHAKIYTSLGGYDSDLNSKYDKSRMDLIPDEDLLPYAGGDTDATMRVSNQQIKALAKDKKLARFYKEILHPSIHVYQKMEQTGILVDTDYLMEFQAELRDELDQMQNEATKYIPRRLAIKYRDNLAPTRPALIKDFLFSSRGLNLEPKMITPKSGEPATKDTHLAMFMDHPDAAPYLTMLSEYSKISKMLSTYAVGFLKHLRADGRLHPTAVLYKGDFGGTGDSGTVTGRLAFRDPAFQTTPKRGELAKRFRKAFIAPPGYVIMQLDYSQGELRITACLAKEQNMIDAYRSGIDLHLKTGAELAGIPLDKALAMMQDEDKEIQDRIDLIRYHGKAPNFGLIYGMMPPGYMQYAKDTFGQDMSMDEAVRQRDTFFRTYPRLLEWHDEYKNAASQLGYIRSPLGRVRHLPLIKSSDYEMRSKSERQAINSPVQATLSDMLCWALAEVDKVYGGSDGFVPVGMIHDSMLAYVKEDEVEVWAARVKEIMENLPFDKVNWEPQLKFTVDAEYGPNLAGLKKMP